MIEEFWDAVQKFSNKENALSDSVEQTSRSQNLEDSFLAALPVVRKIVRRRLLSSKFIEISDLEQGILLRLLNWRRKHPEKSGKMSHKDWESYAARTAYNETNRHFSEAAKCASRLSLDDAEEIESRLPVTGDSEAEFRSLVSYIWQKTCGLSLRQRRALLLHSRKMVIYLLTGGITDGELARSLNISEEDWQEIKLKLPLSNASIANLVKVESDERRDIELIIKSIKKARHEARVRLRLLTNK
jgi:hypothetical protein